MDRITKLKEFLLATPQDSFLKHALALEYIKLNDDDTAQQLFEEILQYEPQYIGSYYHLGKLLERKGYNEQAIAVYERGMKIAKATGDLHAYNELRAAHDELVD